MRHLTDIEITALKKNGCYSKDWSLVEVHDAFDPDTCFYSTFIGKCYIGDLSGYRDNELGIPLPNGIRHALITSVTSATTSASTMSTTVSHVTTSVITPRSATSAPWR